MSAALLAVAGGVIGGAGVALGWLWLVNRQLSRKPLKPWGMPRGGAR